MRGKGMRKRLAGVLVGSVIGAGLGVVPATAADFEPAPAFKASERLPGEVRQGPGWTVDETVRNDGMVNIYTIKTPDGPLTVQSTPLLRIRVQEFAATDKMNAMQRSDVYVDAVGRAATGPLRFAKNMVTSPLGTVNEVVEGTGQMVRNVGHALFGKPSEQEEGVAKAALGVATAKRAFAKRFQVDPYSSNAFMQSRLNELAWASAAGGLTVGAAFGALGGTAGTALQATKFAGGVNALVYDKSPDQLKTINAEKLKKMGVSATVSTAFLDHPTYSPTRKTAIVAAMEQMKGVADRSILFDAAVGVNNEPDTFLWQWQAEMMAAYHTNVSPVARLVRVGARPAMQTKNGVVVVAVPNDYFAWTKEIEDEAKANPTPLVNRISGVTGKEVWFAGDVSPLARAKLEARGWTVKNNTQQTLTLK